MISRDCNTTRQRRACGREPHFRSRAKHVPLRLFYIREVVQESRGGIHYVPTEDNNSELGTIFPSKLRHWCLIRLIKHFKA